MLACQDQPAPLLQFVQTQPFREKALRVPNIITDSTCIMLQFQPLNNSRVVRFAQPATPGDEISRGELKT